MLQINTSNYKYLLKKYKKGAKMKKYYTSEDVAQGIKDKDGTEIFPPLEKRTQDNLRTNRRLSYCKIGGKVYYSIENLQEYIQKNTVQAS